MGTMTSGRRAGEGRGGTSWVLVPGPRTGSEGPREDLLTEAHEVARDLARCQARRVELAGQLHDEHGLSWHEVALHLGATVTAQTWRRWVRGETARPA